ncbi:MAG: hypothetical protein ACREMS_09700 [Gemmatimonadaceae bacterium]
MKKQNSGIISLVVVALVTVACNRNPSAPVIPVPPEIPSAPTEIVVGTTALRLTTSLWRNFQPSSSPDTRLFAQLRVESPAGGLVPSGLKIEKAWLILGDEAWISIPQVGPASTPNSVEYMSRGGPEWPIGGLVTAVIQLRDANNNVSLLRAAPQAVGRVD